MHRHCEYIQGSRQLWRGSSSRRICCDVDGVDSDSGFNSGHYYYEKSTHIISVIFFHLPLKQYQAPLSIGFLLGVLFITTNQMLILFAIFADHSQKAPPGALQQADKAMATFSFFLFLVYAAFTTMLATFRADIIKEGMTLFA